MSVPSSLAEEPRQPPAARAICIGAVLLAVGAFWVLIQEVLLNAGSLTATAPAIGVVGLFLALLSILLLLRAIRRRWGMQRRELLIVYCMLATFLPLASQGLWHRFIGILVGAQTSIYFLAPVPPYMVPRGPELIVNGDFAAGLSGWDGNAAPQPASPGRPSAGGALLINDTPDRASQIRQWIPRRGPDGRDRFLPDQKFATIINARVEGSPTETWLSASLSADGQHWREPHLRLETNPSIWTGYSETGFDQVSNVNLLIPQETRDGLWLKIQLSGPGRAEIQKVSFYSNEPAYELLEGGSEVPVEFAGRIPQEATARVHFRPTGALARLLYYLRGGVPWGAWAGPLASWGLLWVAMFGAMFSAAAILFRQWSDREKLSFPLTQFPLLLTAPEQEGRRQYMLGVLRSGPMWFGVVAALVIYAINGLHFYQNDFPGLPLQLDLAPILRKAPWTALHTQESPFEIRIILLGVGIAFFMDLQMAFNLWFFYLLCKLLLLVPYYQGRFETPAWPMGPAYSDALWSLQGLGAAIAIALFSLWQARHHVTAVINKAFSARRRKEDAGEPMPYRLALAVLLISLLLAGIWGELAGIGWGRGMAGMGLMLLFAIMASRVRAEVAAPGMAIVPAMPLLMFIVLGGLFRFHLLPLGYIVLTGSFMCAGFFLMTMPALMETFRIADVASIDRRTIGAAMVVGFAVAVLAGGYILLSTGYGRGLATMRGTPKDEATLLRWRMETAAARASVNKRVELARKAASAGLTSQESEQLAALDSLPGVLPQARFVGYGMAITIGLAIARLRFLTFPFHPLGYALAATPMMHAFWFSTFLAWLIRLIGTRLGGTRMVRDKLQPCMIGVIVGSVLSFLIWDVIGIYLASKGYTGPIYVNG